MAGAGEEHGDRVALAGEELDRLTRRLQGLSQSGLCARREAVEAVLAALAVVAASAGGRGLARLPAIPDHALVDALTVIGHDALDAISAARDDPRLTALIESLQVALDTTR
jgi:hypothetical protein